LAAVNQKLHDQGILPGFDIVGIRGSDFVTKSTSSGGTELFDSTNLNNHHTDSKVGTSTINGRVASLAVSGDVLKSQGIENPTENQIQNYDSSR
jgi:hypothetical protein